MSLDVYLIVKEPVPASGPRSGIFIRENGATIEITREEWDRRRPGVEPVVAVHNESDESYAYSRNITHNLALMAQAAGIYEALWRPEEIGIETAKQLIAPLAEGLQRLSSDPARFRQYNPENGWGSYEDLVAFVGDYLLACWRFPEARVEASR